MRLVIQRVLSAEVKIGDIVKSEIKKGLLVFLGIEDTDTDEDVNWLCGKVARLRLFDDVNGVMNHSVAEINGDVMVVSQFTLHASTRKGNRPSYIRAAKPEIAIPLYEKFLCQMEAELRKPIACGAFGADMKITLLNDGPVTIIIDSKNKE